MSNSMAYLAQPAPARQTPVPGKSPADARSRSSKTYVCTDGKYHDDGSHHSCARSRLDCLMEDRHEGECRILCKNCIDVAEAEQHAEHHDKA